MQSGDWQRIRELFEQALEQPVALRAAFLDAHCAADASLRAEVEALLLADARAAQQPDQLAAAAPALLDALASDPRNAEPAGAGDSHAGAWRLLHEIGRGGMGTVYLATRDDGAYTQQAAVKLLRSDWADAGLTDRLQVERQILAGLDHPGIARLLDGGSTAAGRPYLVLEFVDGQPIPLWCDSQRLSIHQRLAVFLQVCAAVAYAHRRLIVHRDLKPSNILVSGDGQVKLLDFGIAKLLQDSSGTSSAERTIRAFTPAYAAPEQVRGAAVTTGVDVHALGLLLYELLTGRRAFGQPDSTPAAYEQAILHQIPDPPSQTVAAAPVDVAAEQASARQLTPASHAAALRGDLDAIVLKALRKEPEQRYGSVEALADDLQRHLALQPVQARRGRWRYRLGRFLRRHALAAGLGVVALTAVLAGAGFSLWQASVARAERDRAQTALASSEAVTQFVTNMLAQATPDAGKGRELSVREVLDTAAAQIDQTLADQPEVRARIHLLLAQVYDVLDASAKAEVQARAAAKMLAQVHGPRDIEVTDALSVLANILRHRGALDESRAVLDDAYQIAVADIGADAEESLWLLSDIGVNAYQRAQYNEAADAFTKALTGLRKLPDPNVRAIANVLHNHAAALNRAERYAEAEAVHLESLAIRRSLFTEPHSNIAVGLHQLGVTKAAQKQYPEAERYFRDARSQYVTLYGEHDSSVLYEDQELARLQLDQGHADVAIQQLRPLLARFRALAKPDPEDIAICAMLLAKALQRLQQNSEATTLIDEAIATFEHLQPDGHSSLANALQVRLALIQAAGGSDCALAQRIVELLQRSYGPQHSRVVAARQALCATAG